MLTSPEYRAFHDAKGRCLNNKHPRFSDWGGRGICFNFSSFEEFLSHIGPRPDSSHSLNRINNDGHYEVGNVEWTTRSKQLLNRRHWSEFPVSGIKRVVAKGLKTPKYIACVTVKGKYHRLYYGPSLEEAVNARKAYEDIG